MKVTTLPLFIRWGTTEHRRASPSLLLNPRRCQLVKERNILLKSEIFPLLLFPISAKLLAAEETDTTHGLFVTLLILTHNGALVFRFLYEAAARRGAADRASLRACAC